MTEVERFELRLRMDATITVFDSVGQPVDWLKPGTEASQTWKGVPTEAEVAAAYQDLSQVANLILQDVIVQARKRLDEARRGG